MEIKVSFLQLNSLYSEKKSKNYYRLSFIYGKQSCNVFLDKDTFDKLSSKKLEYLKEYTALFDVSNSFGSLSLKLIDLK